MELTKKITNGEGWKENKKSRGFENGGGRENNKWKDFHEKMEEMEGVGKWRGQKENNNGKKPTNGGG